MEKNILLQLCEINDLMRDGLNLYDARISVIKQTMKKGNYIIPCIKSIYRLESMMLFDKYKRIYSDLECDLFGEDYLPLQTYKDMIVFNYGDIFTSFYLNRSDIVYKYLFTPFHISYEMMLIDLEDNSATFVTKSWFTQRTIEIQIRQHEEIQLLL